MPPTLSAANGTPASRAIPASPSTSLRVCAARRSWKPSAAISRSVVTPAATASGLPDRVPAWYTLPSGARKPMMSRRPPKAAAGMPPPMTLPRQVRSGVMPYSACAQPSATRKPVITSSKISTVPCSVHSARMACRNAVVARTRFMLPATGSTMTAAISLPWRAKASRRASASLYGRTMVCLTTSSGTPAEEGAFCVVSAKVSRPEPALTSRLSACPW